MGYAFTALLEREGKLLTVTFGARHCEEAEVVAPTIAASLGARLKELRLTTGQPPVAVMPATSHTQGAQATGDEKRAAIGSYRHSR